MPRHIRKKCPHNREKNKCRGALPSASTTAKESSARAAVALPSALTTVRRTSAEIVGARSSARSTAKEAHARAAAALPSVSMAASEASAMLVRNQASASIIARGTVVWTAAEQASGTAAKEVTATLFSICVIDLLVHKIYVRQLRVATAPFYLTPFLL